MANKYFVVHQLNWQRRNRGYCHQQTDGIATQLATGYKKSSSSWQFQALLPLSFSQSPHFLSLTEAILSCLPTPPPLHTGTPHHESRANPSLALPLPQLPAVPAAASRWWLRGGSKRPRAAFLPRGTCRHPRGTPVLLLTGSTKRSLSIKIEAGDLHARELHSTPELWVWIRTITQISSRGHHELSSALIKWLSDSPRKEERVPWPSAVRLKIQKESLTHWIKSPKHRGYCLCRTIYSLCCFVQN